MKAVKIKKYVVEPKSGGLSESWESFHATNPSSMRLPGYPGVFLAYRAGGAGDRYFLGGQYVYGSSMGLCILDERGEEVKYRFPLPILRKDRGGIRFPQNQEEFDAYEREHHDADVVFHDFRFVDMDGYVYVLTHEGGLTCCYDAVYRVRAERFIELVNRTTALMEGGFDERAFAEIWYETPVFEPCGVGGTPKFYGSPVNKNDIVALRCGNGRTRIIHRILPDCGVCETAGELRLDATADGLTRYGHLENCVRPGYFDNSHIGNNGNPVRAKIGETEVFIDVVHGVHNESLSIENPTKNWDMTYLPFFRILDADDGHVLYYGEEPVLDLDETWKEYVEDGAWVSRLDHLRGVMFAGGQVAADPDRISEDDPFTFYTGVGDTAVARAAFTVRGLTEPRALEDIKNLAKIKALKIVSPRKNVPLDNVGKWKFELVSRDGEIEIHRCLEGVNGPERGVRPIHRQAGAFDFAGRELCSEVFRTGYGYVFAVKGYSFDGSRIEEGYGVMILMAGNPEKLYYRSIRALPLKEFTEEELLGAVPERVKFEILRTEEFMEKGATFRSDLTKWLLDKSEAN